MLFDELASGYDAHFTRTRSAALLRDKVHARLLEVLRPGDHVLELGCGTGEDAAFLGSHGIRVTATDASSAMLEAAALKNADSPLVDVRPLDVMHLHDDAFMQVFDAVLANFGVLNVLHEYRALANWLAPRIRHRGRMFFVVMSPYCVWEVLWHGAHLDFKTAGRRLKGRAAFRDAWIYYPTPRHFSREFLPHFSTVSITPIGLYLPPSEVYAAVEKRPRLWNALASLEKRAAPSFFAALADHYLIELERA